MLRWCGAIVLLVSVMGISMAVHAEEIVYERHTVVEFGDDTIDGDLSRPDGAYLESIKKQHHKNLIKIRSNFRPEILQSVRVL